VENETIIEIGTITGTEIVNEIIVSENADQNGNENGEREGLQENGIDLNGTEDDQENQSNIANGIEVIVNEMAKEIEIEDEVTQREKTFGRPSHMGEEVNILGSLPQY